MNFIKKVFQGEIDESVHRQFKKFGKGKFENRALVLIKNTAGKASIKTGFEYANELVEYCARKLPIGQKVKVTGIIISTNNLREELDREGIEYQDMKQFMGIKQIQFDNEISKEQILEICEKFPNAFISLSFSTNDTELKIKAKSPKSAKPSTKSDDKIKADFCIVKTSDIELIKSFAFDIDNFKSVEISHTFEITDLICPVGEKDPTKIRELAKRKGKIIRKLKIDGKEIVEEKEFEA